MAILLHVGSFGLDSEAAGKPETKRDRATDRYYSANALYNKGLYEVAIKEYRAFLSHHSRHEKTDSARLGLALSLYASGAYKEADPIFVDLLRRNKAPDKAQVTLLLAQCKLKQDRFSEAEKQLQALLRKPGSSAIKEAALAALVEACYAQTKWADVIKPAAQLEQEFGRGSYTARAQYQAALAYQHQAKHADAAAILSRLANRKDIPDTFRQQAFFLQGESLRADGKLAEAINAYSAATKPAETSIAPDVAFRLAYTQFQVGQYDRAIPGLQAFLKTYKQHQNTPEATVLLGRAYIEKQDYARAQQTLTPVVQQGRPSLEAILWLARCYSRQGRYDKAEATISQYRPRIPTDQRTGVLLFDLANARIQQDKLEAAAQALQKLREEHGQWDQAAAALRLQALCYHRIENYAQSLSCCRDFLKAYPKHDTAVEIRFLELENLVFMNKDNEALSGYLEFVKAHPDDDRTDQVRLRLAQIYRRADKWQSAVDALAPLTPKSKDDKVLTEVDFMLGDSHYQISQWDAAIESFIRYLKAGDKQANAAPARLKLALAYNEKGDLDNAIRQLSQVVEHHRDSPRYHVALTELGRLHYRNKDYPNAKSVLQRVINEKAPAEQQAEAFYYLAWSHVAENNQQQAATAFGALAERFPKDPFAPEARMQQAALLLHEAEFVRAAEAAQSYIKSYPQGEHVARMLHIKGVALARREKWDEAEKPFARVVADYAASDFAPRALYEWAWCLRQREQTDAARQRYAQLIRAYPKHERVPRSRLELAELEFENKAWNAAIQHLTDLINNNPDDTLRELALYRLGWTHDARENWGRAAAAFEQLIADFPQTEYFASASFQAGEARLKRNEYPAARNHFEQAVKAKPKREVYEPALLRLGETQALTDLWSESQQSYRTFLQTFKGSQWRRRAQMGQGWALQNQAKYDEAIARYRHATDTDTRDQTAARSQFQIGECHFLADRHEEALQELIKVDVLYAFPRWSSKALLEMGRVLEDDGKTDEARKQYQELIEKHPESDAAIVAREQLNKLPKTTTTS